MMVDCNLLGMGKVGMLEIIVFSFVWLILIIFCVGRLCMIVFGK